MIKKILCNIFDVHIPKAPVKWDGFIWYATCKRCGRSITINDDGSWSSDKRKRKKYYK